MNLSEIEAELYDRLGFDGTPEAVAVNRLRRFINATQHKILSTKGCTKLRRTTLTFPTIANYAYATLPQAAVKVLSVFDTTNVRSLDELFLSDIRRDDPGLLNTAGNPIGYVVVNVASSVARQPSAAADIFVKSTAAGDGAAKTAFLEGVTSGGYYRSASIALNGVTAVSFGVTDWIEVTKFYIALTAGGVTTAAGTITLNQTSGVGTELARIPITRTYPRYTRLQIYPRPSAVLTLSADVELHIENMAQATDEPYLPEDFHELLVTGPLMRDYERREKYQQYAQAKAEWKDMMGELKLYIHKMPKSAYYKPGYSQLGPYYPAGS